MNLMAVTRLQRRVRRRRIKSIKAADYLQKITFTPVVQKIDIDEIKKNFSDNKNNENRQKSIIISSSAEDKVKKSDKKKTVDTKKVISDKKTDVESESSKKTSGTKEKENTNKSSKNNVKKETSTSTKTSTSKK